MDPFIGEIRIFAGTYAPVDWALCNGQLLSVSQYGALYSLLGTKYGGDGTNNFGVPDMRGRLPMHFGTGLGLTPRTIGQRFGTETVNLTEANLPQHTHALQASSDVAVSQEPGGNVLCNTGDVKFYHTGDDASKIVNLAASAIANNGEGQAHSNMMPYLCLNFIISLEGFYPSRS
jgi:microcystin-dependent protein